MKQLLIVLALCSCLDAFSQEQLGIGKLLQPYKKVYTQQSTDSLPKQLPGNTYVMPNAIRGSIPAPRRIGNNVKGHDIYILPVDNMPIIKPDSTYHSNMYTGARNTAETKAIHWYLLSQIRL